MTSQLKLKIEKLRIDYSKVRRRAFKHFFCPILFIDEDTELCKAHIINTAFPDSSGEWTVQRKDIDNFYGSIFESEFLTIKYHELHNLEQVIFDKRLSKKYDPKIFVDGEPVDFFIVQGDIPSDFTKMRVEGTNGETIDVGLKISPEEFLNTVDQSWEFGIEKDVRIPAIVSLMKAAHLTMFEIVGYQYALSPAGYFIGSDILGKFFLQNCGRAKSIVLNNAYPFFKEFAHMVRPIEHMDLDFQGTVTDKTLLVCSSKNGNYWAFIVFIKISNSFHAVMVPVFDRPETVAMFLDFLKNDLTELEVNYCKFERGQWLIDKQSFKLLWPKDGILYP